VPGGTGRKPIGRPVALGVEMPPLAVLHQGLRQAVRRPRHMNAVFRVMHGAR